MSDYLSKPIQPGEIEQKLLRWLPESLIGETEPELERQLELDADVLEALRTTIGAGFADIMRAYNDYSQEHKVEVQGALQTKDADKLAYLMHAFKGCANQIGAYQLGELAREIELMALDNDFSNSESMSKQFLALCGQVETAVAESIEEAGSQSAAE